MAFQRHCLCMKDVESGCICFEQCISHGSPQRAQLSGLQQEAAAQLSELMNELLADSAYASDLGSGTWKVAEKNALNGSIVCCNVWEWFSCLLGTFLFVVSSGFGRPRGLQNLRSCRLLTKSRQMSLGVRRGRLILLTPTAGSRGPRGSCCPRAVWKMERHLLRWSNLHRTSVLVILMFFLILLLLQP